MPSAKRRSDVAKECEMAMEVDLNNPIPDICEIVVSSDGRRGRVTGWWKLVPLKGGGDNVAGKMLDELLREDPEQPNHKLIQCQRREASVLGLADGLVRVDSVSRVGKYVDWPRQMILDQRSEAENLKNGNGCGFCLGYKKMLQRLFPEIDFDYT